MDAFGSLGPVFVLSRAVGLAPIEVKKLRRHRVAVISRRLSRCSFSVLGVAVVVLTGELAGEGSQEAANIGEPFWLSVRLVNLAAFLLCSAQLVANAAFRVSLTASAANALNQSLRVLKRSRYGDLSAFVKKYLGFGLFSFFLCFCHGLVVNAWLHGGDAGRMLQVAFFFVFLFLMNVHATQFAVLAYVVRYAHRTINRLLAEESRLFVLRDSLWCKLRTIRRLDMTVRDCLRVFCLVYEPFLLFYISWIFTTVVHGFTWVIRRDFSLVNLFLWSFYYVTQVLSLLAACASTSAEKAMDVFGSFRPVLLTCRALGLAPLVLRKARGGPCAKKSRGLMAYSFLTLGTGIVFLLLEIYKRGYLEVVGIRELLWSSTVILKLTMFFICNVMLPANAVLKVSHTTRALNSMNRILKLLRVTDYGEPSAFVRKCFAFNMLMYSMCFFHGYFWFYESDIVWMMQSAFQYIYLFLLNLYVTKFIVFVYLIGYAHKTINETLAKESRAPEGGSRLVAQLKRLRNYDMKIKDNTEVVNHVYMPFAFFYIFWIFAIKIHGVMWIGPTNFSLLTLLVYSIYYDGQIVSVVAACCSTCDEAEKTANYLHELFIDNDDPELKEEIEIFSLQLLHRKVEFNACGFFKLDFSLLYSMVGAVTTYIIILMQFQGNNAPGVGNCIGVNCTNCTAAP